MTRRLLLLFVVLAGGVLALQLLHDPVAVASGDDAALVEQGEQLYITGCVSCHGDDGVGVAERGPSLVGVGDAAVHFYVSTGRMPAVEGTSAQAQRKPPVYDEEEIDALAAYIRTFGGGGPPVPDVDIEGADVALGGELYRANCAACHQAAGIGGALSYGNYAPTLDEATAQQVVEAMRVGPGQMPVFDEELIPPDEAEAIAAYVEFLRNPDDPGGLPLGRVGPVTEGFVALLFGLGGVVVMSAWIVHRRRHAEAPDG